MRDDLAASSSGMAGAKNYHSWTFQLCEPYLRGRVLEVGCGVGNFSSRIATHERVSSLLSIDVSEAALRHCRANVACGKIAFRQASLFEVDDRFDTIICMHVIEHIEDDFAAIAHMLDCVAPGGTLFLIVPAHQALFTWFDASVGHYRRYSKRMLTDLITRLGDSRRLLIDQWYYNTVAAIGYFCMYRVLGRKRVGAEVGIFDRVVAPVLQRIEPRWVPFGIALAAVIRPVMPQSAWSAPRSLAASPE
jgi:SAM-dependent methyltransferase